MVLYYVWNAANSLESLHCEIMLTGAYTEQDLNLSNPAGLRQRWHTPAAVPFPWRLHT